MTSRSSCWRTRLLVIGIVAASSLWLVSSVLAALREDTTIADLNAGDVGSCYVAPSTWDGGVDGEVILSPTLATGFPGTSVPSNWYTGSYNGTDFPIVASDFITVDTSYAGVTAAYALSRTLEFEAVFTGPRQWIGFAFDTNLFETPWALFGTFDSSTDLFADTANIARTWVIAGELGIPHRFRIHWEADVVNYYIDDELVATHNVAVSVSMRPVISDNEDGNELSVDWLRMGPSTPISCTYASLLVDSGIANPNWTILLTGVYIPIDTSVSFETRSGDTTDTSDTSWSTWAAVSGDVIASPSRRYLQYRALLDTTNGLVSPRVYSVQPEGETPTAVAVTGLAGRSGSQASEIWSVPLAVSLGVLGLILLRYSASKRRETQPQGVGTGQTATKPTFDK